MPFVDVHVVHWGIHLLLSSFPICSIIHAQMAETIRSAVVLLLAATFTSWAGEFRFHSTGIRAGMSTSGKPHEFLQMETFADWDLPWKWDLGADWSLVPRFPVSAGWLHQHRHDAFVGTLGPSLTIGRKDFPLTLVAGISPTFLSQTTFYSKEFGSHLEFTDYVGLNYEPGKHWLVGYRYQHMSNASFSHRNPGLNLHMFQLGYRF